MKDLKEKLFAAYERLDASNENMQSFNEELISANEEMQSTNEEMQSVNEELHTINTDYQLKNKELLETNDDLNNYFRSNINGQLFINNDLKLMKFSPSAVEQINLLESDIGRPLHHISTNIKFENIIPSFVAAFCAHYICLAWQVKHTVYSIDIIPSITVSTISWTMLAGLIFGLAAFLFIYTGKIFEALFSKIKFEASL